MSGPFYCGKHGKMLNTTTGVCGDCVTEKYGARRAENEAAGVPGFLAGAFASVDVSCGACVTKDTELSALRARAEALEAAVAAARAYVKPDADYSDKRRLVAALARLDEVGKS